MKGDKISFFLGPLNFAKEEFFCIKEVVVRERRDERKERGPKQQIETK